MDDMLQQWSWCLNTDRCWLIHSHHTSTIAEGMAFLNHVGSGTDIMTLSGNVDYKYLVIGIQRIMPSGECYYTNSTLDISTRDEQLNLLQSLERAAPWVLLINTAPIHVSPVTAAQAPQRARDIASFAFLQRPPLCK